VTALENLRLDLLRLRAGVGDVADLTAALEAARSVSAEIGHLVAGRAEVEAVLSGSLEANEAIRDVPSDR